MHSKAHLTYMSRCGGTVYALVSKTSPARVEGSNLSTGITPPLKSTDVHLKLKFQVFVRRDSSFFAENRGRCYTVATCSSTHACEKLATLSQSGKGRLNLARRLMTLPPLPAYIASTTRLYYTYRYLKPLTDLALQKIAYSHIKQ